ncbi:DUF3201 domain-containing protein [Tissierella sp. MSJ-40]|uniref:DUF3201 domain-containing protein n=1 Tax=Tissierella simiarum TaxID=2841534 RepID=A0ABS6E738_9FIRM|nr:DUF3201 domain-containing protein [Tissierella simiarum]MBU5438735.1 DUF3201 domain-containing protein [Tissierella simiarum]
MESNITNSIHNKLNYIYSLGEDVFESIKNESNLQVNYGLFNGHYIKINGRYEYQKYPIPVVAIEGIGDIGFNINGIWFEFFIDKVEFNKVDIENLISRYKVEIYGGNNCLIDFYTEGKSVSDISHNIDISDEETVGIAIYLDNMKSHSIKEIFFDACKLLNL